MPSSRGFPNPGIERVSLLSPALAGRFFTTSTTILYTRPELQKDYLTCLMFTFYFHALEKEMATHSSVLAWRIPGTGEPGGLPSIGSHRVGHD